MNRVARALIVHELVERLRDRWVLVATILFALLAIGITLYGREADEAAGAVTAPSLVTLAAFLVPLVALVLGHDAIVGEKERNTLGLLLALPVSRSEVLFAKVIGRTVALVLAIVVGLGSAALLLEPGQRASVLVLLPRTVLLGTAFLSIGTLVSVVARRHTTAASLAVVAWFMLVFFWDLALLALMVATDGAMSQELVSLAVSLNPAGLYRTGLMIDLLGQTALEEMGLVVSLPGTALQGLLWTLWIVGPVVLGAALLGRPRAVTS